jgi:hypothetical protein
MDYAKARPVRLKNHISLNEKWLQEKLSEDPDLLGLGELTLRDTERKQSSGGRLDLLLEDDESRIRYCVEIQLGPVDESHIVRTLEYWDNERTRNPHIEHIAVIVAEDVTSRFLNVISLFNKSIPLIAINLSAFEVNGHLTLSTVKVLDLSTTIGWEEDGTAGVVTDRTYWLKKAAGPTLELMDKMIEVIREVTDDPSISPKYNKQYVGLARHGVADNFVTFKPRKKWVLVQLRMPFSEEIKAGLEETFEEVSYNARWKRYYFVVDAAALQDSEDALREAFKLAHQNGEPSDD